MSLVCSGLFSLTDLSHCSNFLRRYQTCTDADSVTAMEQEIIQDLEAEDEARRTCFCCCSVHAAYTYCKGTVGEDADDDLLMPNPNHAATSWRPLSTESRDLDSDEDSDQHSEASVETDDDGEQDALDGISAAEPFERDPSTLRIQ